MKFQVFYCIVFTLLFPVISSQIVTWSTIYDSPVIREPKSGWARFCKENKIYDTFANQCPVGVFWDQGHDNKWDCVCTRGPWRRSASWCSTEDTQRFTQGDIACFKPSPEESSGLQGLYYLGDRFSAWDSSFPILLTDYRSGIPIRKGDFSNEWEITSRKNRMPGILIYRPRDDWVVFDKLNGSRRLCLRAPPAFDENAEGLFIYNVSLLFDKAGGQQTFSLDYSRGCYSWNDQANTTWYDVTGENLEQKNMVIPPYNKRTAPEECVKCMSVAIPPTPEVDTDGTQLEERNEFSLQDLKNLAVLKTEVDLQTERLGLYWAYKLLQNGTDHIDAYFQELEILTKAALMAMPTCGSTTIPFQFYQYFLIMFRMLLAESFKKYAPKGPISDEYYAKINELLTKCKSRSHEIKFTVRETCPPLYEAYEGKNGSEKINLTNDYTSDKGRHDFLLEFVWRLKSFLHYNCFEEFQLHSTLHDVMQHQLESLFTEDLILRWFNPGNSFQMYEMIFATHLDLDITMRNFQRCLIAVHDMSKFPVWLKRPIDRPEVKPKPGSGPGGEVPRLKREMERFEKSLLTPTNRRKRSAADDYDDDSDAIKPPNNLFTGSAACIKSITTFMKESGRSADPNCW